MRRRPLIAWLRQALLPLCLLCTNACDDEPPADPDADGSADTADQAIDTTDTEREPGPSPTLEALSPDEGPLGGGNQITATGSHFATPTEVYFGEVEAESVIVVEDTTLSILVPPGAAPGSVDVRVETGDGEAILEDGYRYLAGDAPIVSAIEPVEGDVGGGETVDFTGTNFPTEGTIVVVFGGAVAAAVTLDSDTHFTVTTPAHDYGMVDVTVNFGGGEIQVLEEAFTFTAPLTVDEVLPNVGPAAGGTDVLLLGSGLVDGANIQVFFGDNLADPEDYILQGDQAAVITPAGDEGPVDVMVTGDNGSVTIPGGFEYGVPLLVDTVDPETLPLAGGTVTVTGSGIDPDATFALTVGERFASDVEAASDTELTFTAPAQDAAGTYDLLIDQDGQRVRLEDALTYE